MGGISADHLRGFVASWLRGFVEEVGGEDQLHPYLSWTAAWRGCAAFISLAELSAEWLVKMSAVSSINLVDRRSGGVARNESEPPHH